MKLVVREKESQALAEWLDAGVADAAGLPVSAPAQGGSSQPFCCATNSL